MPEESRKPAKDLRTICGWCGKSEADGAKLASGPVTCICSQCCTLVAGLLQIIPPELIPSELLADPNPILAELANRGIKPPEMADDHNGEPPDDSVPK